MLRMYFRGPGVNKGSCHESSRVDATWDPDIRIGVGNRPIAGQQPGRYTILPSIFSLVPLRLTDRRTGHLTLETQMSRMIESMESRVMLTATSGVIELDLVAGGSALVTAKADLKAAVKEAALDVKGFKTDIKGLKLTSPQKSTLVTLEKAFASDEARTSAAIGKVLATATTRGIQLESALKSLAAHPTKTAIQSKVTGALVKLEAVFSSTVITNAQADVSAAVITLDTDLSAVATAIPSTQATVTTTESDLSSAEATLTVDATSITSAVSTLTTDLS